MQPTFSPYPYFTYPLGVSRLNFGSLSIRLKDVKKQFLNVRRTFSTNIFTSENYKFYVIVIILLNVFLSYKLCSLSPR